VEKHPYHDKNGRFKAGNPGSGGNPQLKKLGMYRKAIAAAVSEEDIQEIFEDLAGRSKNGDLEAIKVLLPYVLGKPKTMEESIAFTVGKFQTAADLVPVANNILEAISGGELTTDAAVKVVQILEVARRTIETAALEERIGALEKVSRLQ
jgi:hypothetical protein